MLRRALSKADEAQKQHLQLSRQHNKRLLAYRLALMDACQRFRIKADGIQIQYDPVSQLFEVHTPRAGQRYPLERALNTRQLPVLANCTRAFLEITRVLSQLGNTAVSTQHPEHLAQDTAPDNLTAVVA